MSNGTTFTAEEMYILMQNPNIKEVTSTKVFYTQEFKERFLAEHEAGKTSRVIFRENGIDPMVLGDKRVWSTLATLKKELIRHGEFGTERRMIPPERKEAVTIKEEVKQLRHEVEYLRQEQEFIKKIIIAGREAKRR